eukprot:SM000209S06378  [mRNA]  locus=s209:170995:176088:+ [translate_table: standard]
MFFLIDVEEASLLPRQLSGFLLGVLPESRILHRRPAADRQEAGLQRQAGCAAATSGTAAGEQPLGRTGEDTQFLDEADLQTFCQRLDDSEGSVDWQQLMEKTTKGMTYTAWRKDQEVGARRRGASRSCGPVRWLCWRASPSASGPCLVSLALVFVELSAGRWPVGAQVGPTEYKSRTVVDDCTPELMRDFFWDDQFRPCWDDMLVQARTLEECPHTGSQIVQWVRKVSARSAMVGALLELGRDGRAGRSMLMSSGSVGAAGRQLTDHIRSHSLQFPFFCKDREYVIGRRIWTTADKVYYCITKGVHHPSAPPRQKPRRVDVFYSSWRIQAVEARDGSGRQTACEVMLFHHEEMGIQKDLAKMGIRQGMWSCVKKIEPGVRRYQALGQSRRTLSRAASMANISMRIPGLESPRHLRQLDRCQTFAASSPELALLPPTTPDAARADDGSDAGSEIVPSSPMLLKEGKGRSRGVRWLVVGSALALMCGVDPATIGKVLVAGVARRMRLWMTSPLKCTAIDMSTIKQGGDELLAKGENEQHVLRRRVRAAKGGEGVESTG